MIFGVKMPKISSLKIIDFEMIYRSLRLALVFSRVEILFKSYITTADPVLSSLSTILLRLE